MIRRVLLENFMSHERTEFLLEEGLNIVSGANNVGKSALAEALRCLATGGRGTDYVVRHGARRARVTVETSEGDTVSWTRSAGGATSYELNGREFLKAGGGVPAEVAAALRLAPVEVGGDATVDVHLADQKEPLFLLARSQAEIARFFSASSDAHLLLRMQALHQQRVSEARVERRTEGARLERRERELEALAGVAMVEELEAGLARQREEMAARLELARGLRERAAGLQGAAEARAATGGRARRLAELAPAESLLPLRGLRSAIERERTTSARVAQARRSRGILGALGIAPPLASTAPLRGRLGVLRAREGQLEAARSRRAALDRLDASPAPAADLRPLRAILARGRALARAGNVLRASATAAARLAPPTALADAAPLRATRHRVAAAEGELAAARSARATLEDHLAVAARELDDLRGELGRCPLCGAAFDDDGRHAHGPAPTSA